MTCATCGAANPPTARFCSSCGAAMTAAHPVELRKTVTVVFTDLVESTSLAERLDPEALAAILERYFRTLRTIVERHGGTVEKFIGDAVVAVFGVPVLHEDDAARAVRTALEIHAGLDRLTAELASSHGVRLRARTGVNTGEVAVGPRAGDTVAVGHPMSMAARLQQAAAPGEILIGAATQRLAGGAIRAEPLGRLAVKGASEAIEAWRLLGTVDEAPRGWQATGPYVGRDRELGVIALALAAAARHRTCRLVTIIAPPGLGKSRLVAEAMSRLDERTRVVVGRCLPYGESITYAPLVEVVRQLEPAAAGGPIERLLAGAPDAEQVAGSIRATIRATAVGSPQETSWAARRLLEAAARDRPLVVVFDDLHWAEPSLLDLVEHVASHPADGPILLLCLARPDLLATRPAWPPPAQDPVVLRLDPLTGVETAGLLAELDGRELDLDTRRRIVEAADGVPLFVEQMLAFAADAGAGSAPPGSRTVVPPTIRALLAARVDRLDPRDREVLARGAIEGEAFARSTILALLDVGDDGSADDRAAGLDDRAAGLDERLAALARQELIRPDPAGPDAFRFNHALIRDAVRDAMPRRVRAELHERFAALEERRHDIASTREVVGHHLEAALHERKALGEPVAETRHLAMRAGRALRDAGRRALGRKEWARAVDLLRRAAELLQVDPAERAATLPELIEALAMTQDFASAEACRDEAVAASRVLADRTAELRAEMAWAMGEHGRGDEGWAGRTRPIAGQAIEHFSRLGDDANLAHAWHLLGMAQLGVTIRDSIESLKQARVHAERADDERALVLVWDDLGGAMLAGRTPYPEVVEFTRAEIAWARERGIAFTEADGGLGEAYGLAALGEWDAARRVLVHLRTLFAALPGIVAQHGETYTLGGSLERDAGDPVAAEAQYREAMRLFTEAGERAWLRAAMAGLAQALLDQGRLDEAEEQLREIGDQAQGGWASAVPGPLVAHARLAMARGDVAAGAAFARRALALLEGSDAIRPQAVARETLAELLAATGDAAGARRELEIAAALHAEKQYVPGMRRTAKALEELALPADG